MDLIPEAVPDSYATVFDNGFLQVKEERLFSAGPGSRQFGRTWVTRPEAVVIVARDQRDDRLLLVRQYRHAVGELMLEFPAGKVEDGMGAMDTAVKELREETGFTPGWIRCVGTIYASPGYSDELISCYAAGNIMPAPLPQDEDERLEVVRMHPSEVEAAIMKGDIHDGKSVAAYLFWARKAGYANG